MIHFDVVPLSRAFRKSLMNSQQTLLPEKMKSEVEKHFSTCMASCASQLESISKMTGSFICLNQFYSSVDQLFDGTLLTEKNVFVF